MAIRITIGCATSFEPESISSIVFRQQNSLATPTAQQVFALRRGLRSRFVRSLLRHNSRIEEGPFVTDFPLFVDPKGDEDCELYLFASLEVLLAVKPYMAVLANRRREGNCLDETVLSARRFRSKTRP